MSDTERGDLPTEQPGNAARETTGQPSAANYRDTLATALARKEQQLASESLPALKEEFARLHNSFNNFRNVLLQKGLIAEDPYKYDQKISEVTIPSTTPILDSEQSDEIGIRLSQYDSQLEFLENYYQFSLEFLTLKRIKLLAKLAKYINWASLSDTSSQINTRVVAIMCGKIRGGNDNFSSQLIVDAQKQMAEAVKRILSILKDVTLFHRESYKLEIRDRVLTQIKLPGSVTGDEIEQTLVTVRRGFSGQADLPFYQELVKEVLIEDLTREGSGARQSVLAGIAVAEKKKKRQKSEPLKPILMEAVRTLAAGSRHLDAALDTLNMNAQYYEEQRAKTGGPLRRWIRRLVLGEKQSRIYEVEFVDVVTAVSRHERIDFDQFLEQGKGLARMLGALSNKMSPRYSRIESSSEEEIYQALERLIIKIQNTQRTMPAIQEFFSSEIPRESRERLKGIKLEINGIQNAVVKANQRRHDYVARQEEAIQLKKLGIDSNQAPGA